MSLDSSGDMKLLLLSECLSRTFMPPQLRGELANAVNALLMKQDGIPEGLTLENLLIFNPEFAPEVRINQLTCSLRGQNERRNACPIQNRCRKNCALFCGGKDSVPDNASFIYMVCLVKMGFVCYITVSECRDIVF